VSFIGHPTHLLTEDQLDVLLDDLEDDGGSQIFLSRGRRFPQSFRDALADRGWEWRDESQPAGLERWTASE
jgi:hypothetical protein